jgi:TfoX/Sxy family transcriptional regulator of competence genes
MNSMDQHLRDLFDAALGPLPFVTRRPMFGCDAFFAKGNIFGLIWDGRVVLKLPQKKLFDEAEAMAGAMPWKPMPAAKNPMAHWVVMGEALHDDGELFAQWVAKAHQLALDAEAAAPAKVVVARKEVVFRPPTPTPPWKRAIEKKRAAEAKKAAPKKKPAGKKKPAAKKKR